MHMHTRSAASFKQAKDQLPVFEYTMMASTAVLEANWAAFYATGEWWS